MEEGNTVYNINTRGGTRVGAGHCSLLHAWQSHNEQRENRWSGNAWLCHAGKIPHTLHQTSIHRVKSDEMHWNMGTMVWHSSSSIQTEHPISFDGCPTSYFCVSIWKRKWIREQREKGAIHKLSRQGTGERKCWEQKRTAAEPQHEVAGSITETSEFIMTTREFNSQHSVW